MLQAPLPHQSKQPLLIRLWAYQKERFPVFKYGILIASFSFCAVCVSALLRDEQVWPDFPAILTAFLCLFLFFLQLRLADEFKDHEQDVAFRPHRPVPRGLVTLSELKWLGISTAVPQLVVCLLFHPMLVVLLLIVWGYFALMTAEFFVSSWLKKRPFAYLCTHMMIMPLIDLFATGCDWLEVGELPSGLGWFLVVSFFNGVVIELGRKIWAPEQERRGVESYSADWGIKTAVSAWLISILLSFVSACFVAKRIDFFMPVVLVLSVLATLLIVLGVSFVIKPYPRKAKLLEDASGWWIVSLYLILGIIPMGTYVWMS